MKGFLVPAGSPSPVQGAAFDGDDVGFAELAIFEH
jgi:hypothetical protein